MNTKPGIAPAAGVADASIDKVVPTFHNRGQRTVPAWQISISVQKYAMNIICFISNS
jgi:hypothetical protein